VKLEVADANADPLAIAAISEPGLLSMGLERNGSEEHCRRKR
jgi:hypothetical protein